jgi:hypothetical protein
MSFDLQIKHGDLVLDNAGGLSIVNGNNKIRQDIIKILLTRIGDNRFHSRYGSDIGSLKIGGVADQQLIELDLRRSAEEAIRYLISLQKSQGMRQMLSLSEVIVDIVEISTERDTGDPRLYNIFVSVLTQKMDIIEETVTLRIV